MVAVPDVASGWIEMWMLAGRAAEFVCVRVRVHSLVAVFMAAVNTSPLKPNSAPPRSVTTSVDQAVVTEKSLVARMPVPPATIETRTAEAVLPDRVYLAMAAGVLWATFALLRFHLGATACHGAAHVEGGLGRGCADAESGQRALRPMMTPLSGVFSACRT